MERQLLGRSPVNEKTKEVNWLAIDIDKKINPQTFCSKIWKELGWQYFCFQTPNRNWRVIEFLDEPLHVEEAADRAKELEERIEKELKIKVDKCCNVSYYTSWR